MATYPNGNYSEITERRWLLGDANDPPLTLLWTEGPDKGLLVSPNGRPIELTKDVAVALKNGSEVGEYYQQYVGKTTIVAQVKVEWTYAHVDDNLIVRE